MNLPGRARYLARRGRQTLSTFDNGGALVRSLVTRSPELVFEIDGLAVHCPNVPGARVPVFEVFAEDEYAFDWFGRGLPTDAVVVDIGAHIGCFSLDLARRFPGVTVHSYEPTPSTSAYTRKNVESNGLAHRIHVHEEAVSARSGTLVMADSGTASGHNGVMHLGESGTTMIEVPCRSIADVFDAAGPRIDVLKMDAEGAEYDVMLASDPALWERVDRLVMEFHPVEGHRFAEIEALLTSAGLVQRRRIDGEGAEIGLAWFSREEIPAR